ncbi:MAG TPA: mannosyltransferase family protein [Solirubrobacteraceae bacterium]|nr:mannosyltransferase family protein [Solirubrobacteraceae bacterium]
MAVTRAQPFGPRALRSPAVRNGLAAFLASRAIVWLVGIPAFLLVPLSGWQHTDPTALTRHLGAVGEILGAPAVRWDSSYYIFTAQHGYDAIGQTAFFPFYPIVVRAVATVTYAEVVAGVLVSLVAFGLALVFLHKLADLDFGRDVARRTVWLVALFPASIFFSAVYTEGLFLGLSVGSVYAARKGSWAWAGLLGGMAALTRNTGVLIGVAVLLLYLYGPRADRPPAPARGRRPRYALRPDALWLLLIPGGLAVFAAYTWIAYGTPFASYDAQAIFHREFLGPFSALWYGGRDALQAIGDLLGLYSGEGVGASLRTLALAGTVVGALVATVGALRRLPIAYGAYALAALLPPLSTPWPDHPLWSTPRFITVVFPCFLWLGLVLRNRRWYVLICVAFALGLAYVTARFSAWYWVA